MALASHYSPELTQPNILLLCAIAAMPFFTGFVSANPGMRVPVLCYCLWMLVTAAFNRRLQSVVTRPPVLDERVSPEQVRLVRQRGSAVILGSATAVVVSLAVPVLGQVMLATIPLWRLVLRRLAERRGRAVALA